MVLQLDLTQHMQAVLFILACSLGLNVTRGSDASWPATFAGPWLPECCRQTASSAAASGCRGFACLIGLLRRELGVR